MRKIVQCVPNISEGRDRERIETIVAPLKERTGFTLVSYEPDADYNRTVITLIGDPDAMKEPLMEMVQRASALIDMNTHEGQHPRMGAVDVMPFIPIAGTDMESCIATAREMGKNIAEQSDIPVFMYAEARHHENRRSLPRIRKGEFEGMKEKMKQDAWKPDYGPKSVHPTAGVTAVGARMPLIAYNIDIPTESEAIAKKLSQAIRGSSGGFKFIQAGPAYLKERGHVQVTMNILNYEKNPIYRVLETVKMEAKRYQLEIISSEVVGLIPQDALVKSLEYYFEKNGKRLNKDLSLKDITDLSTAYIGLRDFGQSKIIEAHIEDDSNDS
ncbi:MAG: glutamate formimidoyltransferase [Candidatus Izemoplasmataceae bacterium]